MRDMFGKNFIKIYKIFIVEELVRILNVFLLRLIIY